jgi:AAA family ATP:ADP antiporter
MSNAAPFIPAAPVLRRSALDRVLGVFTEVRPGEASTALLLALNVFLLLAAYYVIKPAREDLLSRDAAGAEYGTFLSAGVAVMMFVVVPLYAKLVNRVIRTRLVTLVTGFFIACLVGFWLLGQVRVPYLGYVFFIWVGIFNVLVVAQFWAFANDVYATEAGKRLFPIVAVGGNLGAVAGAYVFTPLVESISTYQALLLAGGVLALCILLTRLVAAREFGPGRAAQPETTQPRRSGGLFEGFDLLLRHRFLGFIALLVLVLNLVNTTGEFILRDLFYRSATSRANAMSREELERVVDPSVQGEGAQDLEALRKTHAGTLVGVSYGRFYFWVNLLAVVFQLLLVARLVKYGGVSAALLLLPLVALGTYGLVAVAPILAYVQVGKILENSSDYSVNNTARHMLFLPLSTEIKYKSKQATDSFMQRAGDVLSAGVVFAGTSWLGLLTRGFALVNLAVIGFWLILVALIVRDFNRIEAGADPEITGAAPS